MGDDEYLSGWEANLLQIIQLSNQKKESVLSFNLLPRLHMKVSQLRVSAMLKEDGAHTDLSGLVSLTSIMYSALLGPMPCTFIRLSWVPSAEQNRIMENWQLGVTVYP